MKIIYGLFKGFHDANNAVEDLIDNGIGQEDLGVIAQQNSLPHQSQEEAFAEGAANGAVIGGLAGLLAGIGIIALPGFGALIAAGPFLAALTSTAAGAGIGAAAGGIVGALLDWGVSEEKANQYADGIREGGVLLSVHQANIVAPTVKAIMEKHNAMDVSEHSMEEQVTIR